MKTTTLRSMSDVVNAISESRMAWIERVRAAYLACHESNERDGSVDVPEAEWEALSAAICAPCRLRDGIDATTLSDAGG